MLARYQRSQPGTNRIGVKENIIAILEQNTSLMHGYRAQENRDAIMRHFNPDALRAAIDYLLPSSLLTHKFRQNYFNAVVQHCNPLGLTVALLTIKSLNLLPNDATFVPILGLVTTFKGDPSTMNKVLQLLHQEGILTGLLGKANFIAFLKHAPILIGSPDTLQAWSCIRQIKIEQWNEIITNCERYAQNHLMGQLKFIAYARINLSEVRQYESHYTSPFEATQLFDKISALTALIKAIPVFGIVKGNHPVLVALRSLTRLLDPNFLDYKQAEVSIRHLLGFLYTAIQVEKDKDKSSTMLNTLIEGLCHIQKEEKSILNAVMPNDRLDPYQIRIKAFDILVQVGTKIDPDFRIKMISQQLVTTALESVVKKHLLHHLRHLPQPVTQAEQQQRNNDLDAIMDCMQGMPRGMWRSIRQAVRLELFFQLGQSIYGYDQGNRYFNELVEQGAYVVLKKSTLEMAGILVKVTPLPASANAHAFFAVSQNTDAAASPHSFSPSSPFDLMLDLQESMFKTTLLKTLDDEPVGRCVAAPPTPPFPIDDVHSDLNEWVLVSSSLSSGDTTQVGRGAAVPPDVAPPMDAELQKWVLDDVSASSVDWTFK